MSTDTANQETSEGAPVEPDHVWDPNVAYKRLADGNEEALSQRLYLAAERYSRAPPGHLSLTEMRQVIAGDGAAFSKHQGHLTACEYCAGLKDTLTPSAEEREAFESLVRSHKRPIHSSREPVVALPSAKNRARWVFPFLGGAIAASTALSLYWYRDSDRISATRPAMTCASGDTTCTSGLHIMKSSRSWKNALADTNENWAAVSQNCTAKTGDKQPCELLAAGAQLQAANGAEKSTPAAKVVLAALQGYSFSPAVEDRIMDALHTDEASNEAERRQLEQQLQKLIVQTRLSGSAASKDEAAYAQLAKLHFETGDSFRGYESLSHYVALNSPAAGKALMFGLVEPLKDQQKDLPEKSSVEAKISEK
jgi:hypothetical protein